MRAATRMMFMAGKGRNNEESRGKGSEQYGQNAQRGGQMNGGRYDQEDGRGGMERGGWQNSGWDGREKEGRYKEERERKGRRREEYDDDDEGGGGYAGRFRHSKDQGEHEEGGAVGFDPKKAREWVAQMKNSDGTKGEHFKPESIEQLRVAHCPECDKIEFWAAMNMMYSDYCEVAKKMNVDKPEFYACMAKAFLKDEDAGEGKLAKYMKHVAGK